MNRKTRGCFVCVFYAGFLKNVFPSAWHTRVQSSCMACLISSSVVHTTGSHVRLSLNRLMYRSVLRESLCPSSSLTSRKLCPDRW